MVDCFSGIVPSFTAVNLTTCKRTVNDMFFFYNLIKK